MGFRPRRRPARFRFARLYRSSVSGDVPEGRAKRAYDGGALTAAGRPWFTPGPSLNALGLKRSPQPGSVALAERRLGEGKVKLSLCALADLIASS